MSRSISKAGGYAVSTIDSRPWLSTPALLSGPKTRKSKTPVFVCNKIFEECSQITEDPFWIDIFKKASIGKFPTKFSYKDGHLVYRRGQKIQMVEIPLNPYEAISLCIRFFREYGGLISELDHERDMEEERKRQEEEETVEYTWSTIKKKMKDILIGRYVIDLKDLMSLSDEETLQLRSTIYYGITMRYFHKGNIMVSGRKIISIDGLSCTKIGLRDKGNSKSSEMRSKETRRDTKSYEGSGSRSDSDCPGVRTHFYIDPSLRPTSKSASKERDIQASKFIPSYLIEWVKYISTTGRSSNGVIIIDPEESSLGYGSESLSKSRTMTGSGGGP